MIKKALFMSWAIVHPFTFFADQVFRKSTCQAQTFQEFVLIDAASDTDLFPLLTDSDAAAVNLVDLTDLNTTELSIRAEITPVTTDNNMVGSVRFAWLDEIHVERLEVYSMGGNKGPDYDPVPALTQPGDLNVTVYLYDASDRSIIETCLIRLSIQTGMGGGSTATHSTSATLSVTTIHPTQFPSSSLPSESNTPDATTMERPLAASNDVPPYNASATGALSGELKMWHKITLGFFGPLAGESGTPYLPNVFTGYRLDVTFTHDVTSTTYLVPGFFAADGNAANTLVSGGIVWLVHFVPDAVGNWSWRASFMQGSNVAQLGRGASAGYMDGLSGSFLVGPTDKTGRDLRAHGRLQYVGQRYYQFAGSQKYFLKVGADSPENLLNYEDFVGTPNSTYRKSWGPHLQDYRPGIDPTWNGGRGQGLMGALNYLADQGVNAVSFLTLTIAGDDNNVYPFSQPDNFLRYKVSKLAQWEVAFEHATEQGLMLEIKLQEQENDQLLDGGELGLERKLYFRELVARFGHHLALQWNIGEENTNTEAQRKEFASFLRALDPYQHPIVVHTFPDEKEIVYGPLLGDADYSGASLQTRPNLVFNETLEWTIRSTAAGRPWVVCNDEQMPAGRGVVPDANDTSHNTIRTRVLWGNLMAGGAGVDYYFGYRFGCTDLTCQDWRTRANMWAQSRNALEFFSNNSIPFWAMASANHMLSNANYAWCLALADSSVVVVYLLRGDYGISLDLAASATSALYSVSWFDPKNGGNLQFGSTTSITGGGISSLGTPPQSGRSDWAILIQTQVSATPLPNSLVPSPVAAPSGIPLSPEIRPVFPATPSPTFMPTSKSTFRPNAVPSVDGRTSSSSPTPLMMVKSLGMGMGMDKKLFRGR